MAERRPLNSRDTSWARAAARRLAAAGVAPNRISQASLVLAGIAGLALATVASGPPWLVALLFLLGALAVQGRLLCNLFDGMVAVEGGQGTKDGPFWNEAPDRIADLAILAGLGVGLGQSALGLLAGAGAILTAYLRELGRAEGLPADFSGPMAKPQRMAAVTIGAIAGAAEVLTLGSLWAPWLALWVVAAGTWATALRRSVRLVRQLQTRA